MSLTDSLNAAQIETLRGLVNRLIPPDDAPGAWEAGVGDYIARQLSGQLHSLLAVYRDGLDSLDSEAQAQNGRAFAALTPEQQDALLHRLETGQGAEGWPLPPRHFLNLLANHTAEGYYGDPGQGGNRDALSWDYIGFQNKGLSPRGYDREAQA